MIAVEPKGVEDGCFAHQTGQQTWKVHLCSGTWFLRHSATRITHPHYRVLKSLHRRRAMQVSRMHPCRRKRVTEMEMERMLW